MQPKTSVCDYSAQTFSLIQSQLPVRPDSSCKGFLLNSFLNVVSQVKFNQSDCIVVAENKVERVGETSCSVHDCLTVKLWVCCRAEIKLKH